MLHFATQIMGYGLGHGASSPYLLVLGEHVHALQRLWVTGVNVQALVELHDLVGRLQVRFF